MKLNENVAILVGHLKYPHYAYSNIEKCLSIGAGRFEARFFFSTPLASNYVYVERPEETAKKKWCKKNSFVFFCFHYRKEKNIQNDHTTRKNERN